MRNIPGYKIGDKLKFWIFSNLSPRSTILEIGSGEGTAELAEYYEMYSIEHNPEWLELYHSKYIYAPLFKGYYNLEQVKIPKDYDLLLIDGPQSPHKRSRFLEHVSRFNLNVPIVVDDTHREDEQHLARELVKITGAKHKTINDGIKSFTVIWKD